MRLYRGVLTPTKLLSAPVWITCIVLLQTYKFFLLVVPAHHCAMADESDVFTDHQFNSMTLDVDLDRGLIVYTCFCYSKSIHVNYKHIIWYNLCMFDIPNNHQVHGCIALPSQCPVDLDQLFCFCTTRTAGLSGHWFSSENKKVRNDPLLWHLLCHLVSDFMCFFCFIIFFVYNCFLVEQYP